MKILKSFFLILLVSCVCLSSVSASDDEEYGDLMGEYDERVAEASVADPLYYVNYAVFQFNDKMYTWFIEPAADGYKFVVPEGIRSSVGNFFTNLMFPIRLVNNLLQGEFKDAGTETGIFFINTTVGIGGLFTPAQDEFDLEINDEDFGQTLGSYSIGDGFYIVWPFLGPSTLRDTIGMAGDSFLYPLNYVEPAEAVLGAKVLYSINSTSYRIGDYDNIKKAAIDPYTALKNGYIQQRKVKIRE